MEENIESQPLLSSNQEKKKNKYGNIKDIITLTAGFGFFATVESGISAAIGATFGALGHASAPEGTLNPASGASLAAVATAIPFSLALITLPITVKTWIACQAFRKEGKNDTDCNHFMLSKGFWLSLAFALPVLSIPLVASLVAEPIEDVPAIKGFGIGVVALLVDGFTSPLVGFPTAKIMDMVNKFLKSGEEDKRKFCL